MSNRYKIGYEEAFSVTLRAFSRRTVENVSIDQAVNMVSAENCFAKVNCPSVTSSLKDGFAVVSTDLEDASGENPVKLKLKGTATAGNASDLSVESGYCVKVTTGAKVPQGADAVLACEFTREEDNKIFCFRDAGEGRNIMQKGSDVTIDQLLVSENEAILPAKTGFLAAGGLSEIPVYKLPKVGIIATGDEVIAPGNKLKQGQLYASNLVTLTSWLRRFNMQTESTVIPDQQNKIRKTVQNMLQDADVLLTSGGALWSERDFTTDIIRELGGKTLFHGIRLGPGKGIAMITLNGKPVFCLPGGPPSNEMAFLQIVLPFLLHISGRTPNPFLVLTAKLTESLRGDIEWTQFFQGKLKKSNTGCSVSPLKLKSRLQSQANANALIKIPEGISELKKGENIQVQVFHI